MMFPHSRQGRKKVQASKLFAEFWIWDNFLRSRHYALDTMPWQSIYFRVEKLQVDDVLYMCVFTRSQIHQTRVRNKICSLFREAGRPEPVFVTMSKFRAMQNATD